MPKSAAPVLDLIDILTQSGDITPSGERMVRHYVKTWKVAPFQAVIETHMVSEGRLADTLSEQLRINRIYHVSSLQASLNALQVVPYAKAKEWLCLPFAFEDSRIGKKLEVITADPTIPGLIEALEVMAGCGIVLAVGERSDIVRAIDGQYPLELQIPDL